MQMSKETVAKSIEECEDFAWQDILLEDLRYLSRSESDTSDKLMPKVQWTKHDVLCIVLCPSTAQSIMEPLWMGLN